MHSPLSTGTSAPSPGSRLTEWVVNVAYRSQDSQLFLQVGSSVYTARYDASGLAVLDADLRRLTQHSGAYPFHFVSSLVHVAPRGRGTKKPIKRTEPASEEIIQTLERHFLTYNQGACFLPVAPECLPTLPSPPLDVSPYSDERAGREYIRKPMFRPRYFRRS